jgi:hypothetical protein
MKHTNIRFALQLATVTAFMRAIDTAIEIISGSDDATGEARSMALSHDEASLDIQKVSRMSRNVT